MARKEKNIHYIYKTTCNVTGKWYVGMHSAYDEDDGYMGSGKILRYSIRKHGKENHTREILEYCNSREELVLRETEIVNFELIGDGLCMNLKEGGSGGFSSEVAKLGRIASDKILILKYGDNFKGVIASNYYKSLSPENIIKRNLKIKTTQIKNNFNYNTFEGKTHSDETKLKMSQAKKGLGIGETNSQFGTCWITKDGINMKIKKDELDTYQLDGWIKGRK